MNRKKLSLTARTLFCLALSIGVAYSEPARSTAQQLPLWKVEGKKNTVWLHGSIHFLKAEFYPLPDPIEKAYGASEIVVFEAEMDPARMMGTALRMAQEGMYPPGDRLRDNVSEEVYNALRERLKKTAMPAALIEQMRPWLAAMTLAVAELQRLGFDPEHGVDRYFYGKAQRDGKEIVALETLNQQLRLFTGLTKEEQEAFLQQTIDEFDEIEEMLDEMIAAWRTGDAEALDKLVVDTMREHPEIYKKFLTDRNEAWMEQIVKLLGQDKDVFIVVGAAHLIGADSVVELLRKRGFEVEQK